MMAGATRNLIYVADQADRESWLRARLEGLGGSDLSAILNENPRKSPVNVWNERCDPLPIVDDAGERAEVGSMLEGPVISWYAQGAPTWPRTGGLRRVWRPPLVARRDRLWQRGSADGLVSDDPVEKPGQPVHPLYRPECDYYADDLDRPWDGGVEVKTHGWYAYASDYGNPDEPIPPDKKIQCAWYCELWGVPRWDLVALVDTHLRRQWTYWHDPRFGADLLTIAEDWWKRHIVGRVQPDPDGSNKYSEYLASRFPDSVTQTVTAGPLLDEVVEKLRRARAASKTAETEVERLEQIVQASMGDADTLQTAIGRITWRTQNGRLKTGGALAELYRQLGWGHAEIEAFENKHRGKKFRAFNVDRSWSNDA